MAAHQTSVYNRGIVGRQVVRSFDYTAAGMDMTRASERAFNTVILADATDDEIFSIIRATAEVRRMQKPERAAWEARKDAACIEAIERGFDPDAIRWG